MHTHFKPDERSEKKTGEKNEPECSLRRAALSNKCNYKQHTRSAGVQLAVNETKDTCDMSSHEVLRRTGNVLEDCRVDRLHILPPLNSYPIFGFFFVSLSQFKIAPPLTEDGCGFWYGINCSIEFSLRWISGKMNNLSSLLDVRNFVNNKKGELRRLVHDRKTKPAPEAEERSRSLGRSMHRATS